MTDVIFSMIQMKTLQAMVGEETYLQTLPALFSLMWRSYSFQQWSTDPERYFMKADFNESWMKDYADS